MIRLGPCLLDFPHERVVIIGEAEPVLETRADRMEALDPGWRRRGVQGGAGRAVNHAREHAGVVVGLLGGTDLGARAANRVDRATLRIAMIFFVSLMALYMTFKALW